MPTIRRWPDGAESARQDSIKAIARISERSVEQRALLDALLRRLAPHIPHQDRDALDTLRDAAADNAFDAERALRRLVEARAGEFANGASEA